MNSFLHWLDIIGTALLLVWMTRGLWMPLLYRVAKKNSIHEK